MAMLQLEVVTPERTVLETEAESIIVPGVDGYIGLLAEPRAPGGGPCSRASSSTARRTGRSSAWP